MIKRNAISDIKDFNSARKPFLALKFRLERLKKENNDKIPGSDYIIFYAVIPTVWIMEEYASEHISKYNF